MKEKEIKIEFTILNDSRFKGKKQLKPRYYAINTLSVQKDFAFSHKIDMEEWVAEENTNWLPEKDFMQYGKLSDRKDIDVISIFSCGGDSKVDSNRTIL